MWHGLVANPQLQVKVISQAFDIAVRGPA